MVMILLMLYLVLWVPYIVMAKGDQVAAAPATPVQVRQQWNPYKLEVYRNLTQSYYEVRGRRCHPPQESPVVAEVQLDEGGEPRATLEQVSLAWRVVTSSTGRTRGQPDPAQPWLLGGT